MTKLPFTLMNWNDSQVDGVALRREKEEGKKKKNKEEKEREREGEEKKRRRFTCLILMCWCLSYLWRRIASWHWTEWWSRLQKRLPSIPLILFSPSLSLSVSRSLLALLSLYLQQLRK